MPSLNLFLPKQHGFKRAFGLSFAGSLFVAAVILSSTFWAPAFFEWLSALQHHQLKPWIYFAPSLLVPCAIWLAQPRYRNWRASAGLLAGTLCAIALGMLGLLALIVKGLPALRY